MSIGGVSQILRLFRQYARQLAPFILAVLTLQTVLAVTTIRWVGVGDEARGSACVNVLERLVLLAWILLVAVLGQRDNPTREQAADPIRPFPWTSSLCAKLAVALCFLNLPVLVSDLLILNAVGLPFHMSHLLLRQLPLLAVVVIPGAGAFFHQPESVAVFVGFPANPGRVFRSWPMAL